MKKWFTDQRVIVASAVVILLLVGGVVNLHATTTATPNCEDELIDELGNVSHNYDECVASWVPNAVCSYIKDQQLQFVWGGYYLCVLTQQ